MYLSFHILTEHLKKWNPVLHLFSHNKIPKYIGVQLMFSGQEILQDHIAIGTDSFFNEYFASESVSYINGIVSIGTPEDYILQQTNCIILNSDVAAQDVFYELQKIFALYNYWENSLRFLLDNNGTLQQICTESIPIFNKPFFIHDQNNELLVSVNEQKDHIQWVYDEITDRYYLPVNILNAFKVSEEYQNTMLTFGPQIFSEKQFGYRILYMNLRIDYIYIGRICICEQGDPIREKDFELLEFFAEIIIQAIKQGNFLLTDSISDMGTVFQCILNGEQFNKTQMISYLERFNWNINDSFQCIRIFLHKRDYSIQAITYLMHRLLNIFPESCIFHHKDELVLILDLNIINYTVDDRISVMKKFLEEGLLKSGVSSKGNDFQFFLYYYKEAKIAFQLGEKKNPDFFLYLFDDYIMDYIIQHAQQELLPEMLCSPEIHKLTNYDKIHNTDFAYTLYKYLSNERNIKKTCIDLKIHRSTMNYRISRLQDLLDADLDDPLTRLHLILSFHFLKK